MMNFEEYQISDGNSFCSILPEILNNLDSSNIESFFDTTTSLLSSEKVSLINKYTIFNSLIQSLNNQENINSAAKTKLLEKLPYHDFQMHEKILEIIYIVITYCPNAITDIVSNNFGNLISSQTQKCLTVLSVYSERFQITSEPWSMVDLLFKYCDCFVRSSSADDYISILSYLNSTFDIFCISRKKQTWFALSQAIEKSTIKSVKSNAYYALCHLFELRPKVIYRYPFPTTGSIDILDPDIRKAVISLLYRCPANFFGDSIIRSLLTLRNEESYVVISKLAESEECATSLSKDLSWLSLSMPTKEDTIKIFLKILRFPSARKNIVQNPKVVAFLNEIISDADPQKLILASTIIQRLPISIKFAGDLSTGQFFNNFFDASLQNQEEAVINSTLLMINSLSIRADAVEYIKICGYIQKHVLNNNNVACEAAVNLAAYPRCAKEFEKNGLGVYFEENQNDYSSKFLERYKKSVKRNVYPPASSLFTHTRELLTDFEVLQKDIFGLKNRNLNVNNDDNLFEQEIKSHNRSIEIEEELNNDEEVPNEINFNDEEAQNEKSNEEEAQNEPTINEAETRNENVNEEEAQNELNLTEEETQNEKSNEEEAQNELNLTEEETQNEKSNEEEAQNEPTINEEETRNENVNEEEAQTELNLTEEEAQNELNIDQEEAQNEDINKKETQNELNSNEEETQNENIIEEETQNNNLNEEEAQNENTNETQNEIDIIEEEEQNDNSNEGEAHNEQNLIEEGAQNENTNEEETQNEIDIIEEEEQNELNINEEAQIKNSNEEEAQNELNINEEAQIKNSNEEEAQNELNINEEAQIKNSNEEEAQTENINEEETQNELNINEEEKPNVNDFPESPIQQATPQKHTQILNDNIYQSGANFSTPNACKYTGTSNFSSPSASGVFPSDFDPNNYQNLPRVIPSSPILSTDDFESSASMLNSPAINQNANNDAITYSPLHPQQNNEEVDHSPGITRLIDFNDNDSQADSSGHDSQDES